MGWWGRACLSVRLLKGCYFINWIFLGVITEYWHLILDQKCKIHEINRH
jgi:hypothetical protein